MLLVSIHTSLFCIVILGLDANSKSALVDWETFLSLYCIFEVGAVKKEQLISFWSKFFDIEHRGFCPEHEYLDVLEKLVRGKCMKESSQFTTLFAQNYQQSMMECDVLGEDNVMLIDRLQVAWEEEKLDIYALSASLGREKN